MIQEREIRDRLAALLSGHMSMAAFGEWLADESWDMFSDGDDAAIALVTAINIRVDSFQAGAISSEALRAELSGFITSPEGLVRLAPTRTQTVYSTP